MDIIKKATMEVKNPIVTMEVQDFGTIKLELYPDMAPQTVSNFVALAQHGFYDGLKFHRIVEGIHDSRWRFKWRWNRFTKIK